MILTGKTSGMVKKVLICVMVVAFLVVSTNCASIFYPSRVGQKTHGSLDVGMLVVDILCTGLIGIVVDLATGAIYYPGSYCVPSCDLGLAFNPADTPARASSIALPATGTMQFRLPVRAAGGTVHKVTLLVLAEGGITAACTEIAFTGTAGWQEVGSKLNISAGSATRGTLRVTIDGQSYAEIPVEFDHSAR